MSGYVLGIDGGGTKTELLLADRSGTIVAHVLGAGINPMDNPEWHRNLAATLTAAAKFSCDAATVGIAGYAEAPALDATVRRGVAELLTIPHDILNDVYLAHEAAFPDGVGILLVAGTGSMVVAGNGDARFRVGGWGDQIGDEGSAYWIGRETLNRLTHVLDGRLIAPAFEEALRQDLALPDGDPLSVLLDWLTSAPHSRSAIAALSLGTEERAGRGEPISAAIIAAATEHLAQLVTTARTRTGLHRDAPWSGYGGLMSSSYIRTGLERRLGQSMTLPLLPPACGALCRAARKAGWSIDAAWTERLLKSLVDSSPVRIAV